MNILIRHFKTKREQIIFTPKNIIENIDKIGPWSLYGLAETAISYFYPEYKKMVDEDKINSAQVMAKLCDDWRGIVIRYQKEVGYEEFFENYVNQF